MTLGMAGKVAEAGRKEVQKAIQADQEAWALQLCSIGRLQAKEGAAKVAHGPLALHEREEGAGPVVGKSFERWTRRRRRIERWLMEQPFQQGVRRPIRSAQGSMCMIAGHGHPVHLQAFLGLVRPVAESEPHAVSEVCKRPLHVCDASAQV